MFVRLKESGALNKGNHVVKAYESHSKVKKLLSKFLASDAALHTRVVVATAGRCHHERERERERQRQRQRQRQNGWGVYHHHG